MKSILGLLVYCMLLSGAALGQTYPLAKIHVWSQANLTSINPQGAAREGDNAIQADPTTKYNYYIYAEYRPSFKFTITGIWIRGRAYGIKTEKVQSTPVVFDPTGTGTGGEKKILVPATKNKVLQLFPSGDAGNSRSSGWLNDLVNSSDLVIKYQWKGKTWYYALPKINWLDPAAGV